MEPIENLAREWLRLDQDEATTTVIRHLLEENNRVELEKRLRTRINPLPPNIANFNNV